MKKTIIYGIISIIFILLLAVISYIIINKTARENAIDTILNTKAWMDITFSAKYKDLRNTDTTKTFYKSEKNIKIPMLLYHDIVEEEPERDLFYMYTTQEQFEKQISGLQELGYRLISMEELIQYNKNELSLPEYVALICFDAIRIPIAIHKSNNDPSFFKLAGAKLTVILPKGNLKPLFNMALRTLSLDSLISIFGRPTIVKDGIPLVIEISISIICPFI